MAPKVRVTKEQILKAAMEMVRRDGVDSINARALAAELGCSTQPIFSNFETIEQLRAAVIEDAVALYGRYIKEELESLRYPLYKATGMGYIRFASEEPQLFRMLFMRPVEEETKERGWNNGVDALMSQTGMSKEEAERFHLEMWIFVHGVAVLIATDYTQFNHDTVCEMLTDVYTGLRHRYFSQKEDAI